MLVRLHPYCSISSHLLTTITYRASSLVILFIEVPLLLRICPTSEKFDLFIRKFSTNYTRATIYLVMSIIQWLSLVTRHATSLIAAAVVLLITASFYAIAGLRKDQFMSSKTLGGQGVAQMIVWSSDALVKAVETKGEWWKCITISLFLSYFKLETIIFSWQWNDMSSCRSARPFMYAIQWKETYCLGFRRWSTCTMGEKKLSGMEEWGWFGGVDWCFVSGKDVGQMALWLRYMTSLGLHQIDYIGMIVALIFESVSCSWKWFRQCSWNHSINS
jgi:Uncharacterized conserved protein CG6151-P